MIVKKLWKIIILTSLFILVAGGLWGQATFTWTGADPTFPNAWEEAGNWQVEGSVPANAPDTADDVDIPGSLSNYPITPGSSLAIASLTIANGASLTLGGALTVTGDINNAGTINANGSTFNLTATGAITNTGMIALGGNTLTAASISGGTVTTTSGTITVTGATASTITTLTATTGVTLNGGAGLTVTTALAGSPNLTLSGTVTLGGAVGDITANPGTLTLNAILTAGTIDNAGTINASGYDLTTGAITNTGMIVIAGNTLEAASISGGTVTTSSGTIEAEGTIDTLNVTTGVTLNGGAGLTITNALSGSPDLTLSGTVTLGGTVGNITANQDTLNLNGNLTATGAITNIGTIALGGNTLEAASISGGTVTTTSGTITVTGATASTITTLTANTGVTLNGGAGLTITTALAGSPNLTLSGTVTLGGAVGNITANPGTLNLNGNLTATGDITNTGMIVIAGNTLTAASISDGTVTTTSGIINTTGTITTLTATTGVTLNGGAGLTVTNALAGSPELTLSGIVTLGGTVGNITANPGTLNLNAALTAGTIDNEGTINASGYDLTTGAITNTGTIALGGNTLGAASISGGTVTTTSGIINATGTITTLTATTGVTLNGGAGLTVTNALAGNPNLTLSGIVTLGGAVGNITANPGTLTLNAILTAGDINNAGTINASGSTFNLTATGAITNTGTIALGGNTLGAASISGGTVTTTSGIINATGTITTLTATTGVTLNGGAGLTVTNALAGNPNLTLSGIVTLGGAVGAMPLSSGTTLNLNHPLSTTYITIDFGATLNADTHNITLTGDWTNGGTFSPNGVNQTVIFAGISDQTIVSGGVSFKNLTLHNAGTKTVISNVPLSVNGNLEVQTNQTLNVTGVLAVTGTSSISASITTTEDQTYTEAVTLGANTNLSTTSNGNIFFASTINSDSDSTPRTLTLDAGTGTITFGGVVGGGTSALHQLIIGNASTVTFNGTVRATNGLISRAGTGTSQSWNGTINFNNDLYHDHNGATLTLGANLSCRNLYFYGGNLNIANRTITTSQDFVVFGAGYNPDDPEWDDPDTRFAYYHTPLAYYPAGGSYNATNGQFSTATTSAFTNLTDAKITVGQNFYNNGADMIASTSNPFTLNIPSDSGNNPQFNSGASVISGQWGSLYAVAFNIKVSNSKANNLVTASTAGQGVTNEGNNTNWQFARPTIASAATVFDNVIRVVFSMPIENSNNEIHSLISAGASDVAAGSIWYNGGLIKFTGAYTTADCDTLTNGAGDISEFYLLADSTWNTDATGTSVGDPASTDRSGVERNTIPNLSFLPGLLRSANGKTMIQAYGSHTVTDPYNGTADECKPVLVSVEAGQDGHDPEADNPWDGHNYLQLKYSEPVNIGTGTGFTIADTNAANVQAENNFTNDSDHGGYVHGSSGITVEGYFATSSGALSLASRNTTMASDIQVTSLYRAEPNAYDAHGLYISIAGYSENVGGTRFWPGYITNAQTPSDTVTVTENPKITDAEGNELDHNSPPITVSGTGWDTSPPVIAKVVDAIDNWDSNLGDDQQYEIMSMDIGASRVNYFELHAFDNTPEYSSGDYISDKWVFNNGWQDEKQSGETLFPDTRGGIRASSLHGSLHAFSYEEVGSSFSPGAKSFKTDQIDQTFSTPFFGEPSDSESSDVPYFRLYLEDVDTTVFPMITNFSLSYTAYSSSNPNGGFITDLAGNLMQDFKGLTVDRTPPSISLTLAPIGTNKLYILFSKELSISNLENIKDGLSIENLLSENIGFSMDQPIIKHNSILGTGLIFTLGRDISFDDILNFNVIGSDLIVDKLGVNPMVDGTSHVLSDFALAGIDVLYGYDNRLELLGEGVLGNGEYSLRDFTGQKMTSNTMLTDTDITIATRLVADPNEVEEALCMITDVDPLPLSISTMFNENTHSNWRIWLPTVLPALAKAENPKAKEILQEDGTGAERNFIIPNDSNTSNSFNWKDGDEVEFFFRYGDGSSTGFTFDHDGNEETPEVPLYFFRLENPNDPTSVDLWRFKLSDITKQRGGITILNNVIDSVKKEETILELDLKRAGNVTVHVLTLDGNIVKTLQRGRLNSGLHYFKWNGTNISGASVARGMYFIRVVGPDIDETRKVMVIKQ